MIQKTHAFVALLCVLGLLGTISPTAVAQPAEATVYIGHGIPGKDLGLDPALPVDVSVDGVCLLEGFEFGEIVGPVTLPEGTYAVSISLADPDNPCANDPVIEADVPILAGENVTILAHLTADGVPTASKFVNDVSRPDERKGRLIVHHTAAAPAVDVKLWKPWHWYPSVEVKDFENGDQAAADVWRGFYYVTVAPAGSWHPVFWTKLYIDSQKIYLAYAVGSVANGTFTILTKEVPVHEPKPASVFIVHGIPGIDLGLDPELPVDISVNGDCFLEDFRFGDIVGPAELPAGTYSIAISLANTDTPCGNAPVIEAEVYFAEGENATVIAHLTEDGQPTASKFTNDLSRPKWGRARGILHHTAAAPPVDITFSRPWWRWAFVKVDDFTNGDQAAAEIWYGPWVVSIAPAGTYTPVFQTQIFLEPSKSYLVYAVGSVTNSTFDLLVKKVE
jgi:hypothetical protein